MKNRKKVIHIVIFLLLLSSCVVFFVSHRTYLKYNDWCIIGRSYDEIVERYGEFDRDYIGMRGYYIGKDKSPVMNSHQDMYYWIEFDENDIATEVFVNTLPGG